MGSFAFMPLGFVLAGPVSEQIGISTTLWIGVVWCALSTAVVATLPGIRNVRRIDAPEPLPSGPIRPGRGRRSTEP